MATRTLNRLTALQAAKLKTPGRHSDGGGLYLSIDDGGRRRWVFLYTRAGKRVELGLGAGRDLPLASARTEAAALRTVLAEGGDPKAFRAKLKGIPTFGELADAYVATMRSSWRNPKHAAQWAMTLTVYAAPIRHRPVDEIETNDVLKVLQPTLAADTRDCRALARADRERAECCRRQRVTGRARTRLYGAAISISFFPSASGCHAGTTLRYLLARLPRSWLTSVRARLLPHGRLSSRS